MLPNWLLGGFYNVATLKLGLQLNVECKGMWCQNNVFGSVTHFHKWGRVQEIEPNDF
jgi:hypothetical protein